MRGLTLAFAAMVASGCGTSIVGDFDGVQWAPAGASFAVLDRHDFLVGGGAPEAVRRSESGMKLHLLLTSAAVDASEHWSVAGPERVQDLKHELATTDGLLLADLPLQRALDGDVFTIRLDGDGSTAGSDGEVSAAAVFGATTLDQLGERGLGDDATVRATFDAVDAPSRGGFVVGRIDVQRARGAEQSGEVATGEVSIDVRIPVSSERLGEANLALARPVMVCAARAGATHAGACRDAPADPYVDETGVVR